MIVVSDTTPLISLMKINRLDILRALFAEVLIPQAVYDELTSDVRYPDEAETIQRSGYIRQVSVEEISVRRFRKETGLDLGESEAIIYAGAHEADWLLMDEVKGRRVANSLGIPIIGTVGLLVAACEENILTKADTLHSLDMLKKSGRHIGEEIYRYAIRKIHSMEA